MGRLIPGWVRAFCGMVCAAAKPILWAVPTVASVYVIRPFDWMTAAVGVGSSAFVLWMVPWRDSGRLGAHRYRQVMDRNGGRCARWACTRDAAQADHCWPHSKGCPTWPFLMRPLCRDHNRAKSDLVVVGAIRAQAEVGLRRLRHYGAVGGMAAVGSALAYVAVRFHIIHR